MISSNKYNISGIDIKDDIKLATINWFTTALLPPALSVTIGTAVTGGTDAWMIRIKAMWYSMKFWK